MGDNPLDACVTRFSSFYFQNFDLLLHPKPVTHVIDQRFSRISQKSQPTFLHFKTYLTMEFNQQQLDPAILAEQKAYKASKESFRAAIKTLANEQKDIKPLRKRDARDGVLTPDTAASTHRLNRWELRHLHIAYALFRGKTVPERYYVVAHYKGTVTVSNSDGTPIMIRQAATSPNPSLILKLLKLHVQKATVEYPTKETEAVRDSPSGYGGC